MLAFEEENRLSQDGREMLGRLSDVALRIDALIRGLAEMGRMLRDTRLVSPVRLATVLEEAVAEVRGVFPDLPVEYHLQEPLPSLRVPGPALRQVFVHLLRNAAQARAKDRPLVLQLGAVADHDQLEFWLEDNGSGLSALRQKRLFEPFPGSDRPNGGIGLGLFFVRMMLDAWGGTICVQSQQGLGARFTIVLPVSESNA